MMCQQLFFKRWIVAVIPYFSNGLTDIFKHCSINDGLLLSFFSVIELRFSLQKTTIFFHGQMSLFVASGNLTVCY